MAIKKPTRPALFKDKKGTVLSPEDRYSPKVASVFLWRRHKYVKMHDGPITPIQLAGITTREEFEDLPETFGETKTVTPTARKYRVFDAAGLVVGTRGNKGKPLKIVVHFMDGKRRKSLQPIYFQPKKSYTKGQNQTALWDAIVKQLGLIGRAEYDKVASRFLQDRKGSKKIRVSHITYQKQI